MNTHNHANMFNGRLTDLDIATTLSFASDFLREQTRLPSAQVPLGIANGRILAEPVPLPFVGPIDDPVRDAELVAVRSMMSHVCPSAAAAGDKADVHFLPADTLLTPPMIGLLAAMGKRDVWVRRKLPISALSIGVDLVDAGVERQSGQIYDATRPMLTAALTLPWISANDRGVIADDRNLLRLVLQEAAEKDRVILASGIASHQQGTALKATILGLGGIVLVNSVMVLPGQSAFLATMGTSLLVALPANPIAAWNLFNALGPEILRAAASLTSEPNIVWDTGPCRFEDVYPVAAAE